ncbi:MAG: D-tyrosyl-tRNA(Tyr) deacylase [Firmicutes bacterium]|nr:D-tyrosyl-tRNA(Tyr) deacylase [Bacillota bacterium]HPU00845.1 D-aminoacyl-tRNA deacylase [Bacillota bacterium]
MRAVVQRVEEARVTVKGEETGRIGAGLVVYLGVGRGDSAADCAYLAEKVAGLRIFEDEKGLMNLSVKDIGGGALCISQFTLYGDCRKGRRPSFTEAAPPEEAGLLFEEFCAQLRQRDVPVATGRFGAMMRIEQVNAGPVTILLDSRKTF